METKSLDFTYFATLFPLVAEKGTNPLFHHGLKNFCRALWEQRLLLSSFMVPSPELDGKTFS
jgi:hypothetical protein